MQFITQYKPKIKKLMEDGKPRRLARIMVETGFGKSPVLQVLRAMEVSGEIQKFKAKDPDASHSVPVIWFQLVSKQ